MYRDAEKYAPGEYLAIKTINRYREGDKIKVEFTLDNGLQSEILWYTVDDQFESYICDERCDAAVVTLFLSAIKKGYKAICTDYPISEKLYYNLQYQAIPQLYSASVHRGNLARTKILAPITKEIFGEDRLVATGMSRGVDSFATMYEYCRDFELKDYGVNAFTYFKIGAHHGFDSNIGRGTETREELFQNQLQGTKDFCDKYDYPLIVVESNISWILIVSKMFNEKRFDQTHTLRNLGAVVLLQKGIKRYYYSSTYNLNEFKVDLRVDMAYFEKWLIPLLSTGNVEFYQANQDWRRIDKIEKLIDFEPAYDNLQVCLIQTGNCGRCMKCKRTLMELDAFGDSALEKYRNSFDIETYRKEYRSEWFGNIMEYKEAGDSEAHYFEETFLCACEHHPELIGNLIKEKRDGIKAVRFNRNNVNIRMYPSIKSKAISYAQKDEEYTYLGEWGPWTAVMLDDGTTAFAKSRFMEYIRA